MLIQKLRQTVMFSAFTDSELAHLKEMTHIVHLQHEEALFQQGQEVRSFYFVNDGTVKLSRFSEDGSEKVIELIRPGNFFAEALFFLNEPHYPVQASAVKETELIAIDGRKYVAMLENSVDACMRLLGSMSKRIHSLITDIDALTLHSSRSRVAGYLLLQLAEVDEDTIDLGLAKGILASRLSMKPETFSRALHGLEHSGVISIDKRLVTVNDLNTLQDIANQELKTGH